MRTLKPALGLLLAMIAAQPAPAVELPPPLLHLIADEDVVPLAKVLRSIEARIPGRALDAKVRRGGDQPTYRVKWLGEDGKVRDVIADARSGKILKVR